MTAGRTTTRTTRTTQAPDEATEQQQPSAEHWVETAAAAAAAAVAETAAGQRRSRLLGDRKSGRSPSRRKAAVGAQSSAGTEVATRKTRKRRTKRTKAKSPGGRAALEAAAETARIERSPQRLRWVPPLCSKFKRLWDGRPRPSKIKLSCVFQQRTG